VFNGEIIQKQISKKEAEIAVFEKKLSEARVYIQALQDVLKAAEKDEAESAAAQGTIREGSTVDQARKAILNAGQSMHLDELLKAIGREVTREAKASLNGSLSAYVRKGEIFTRTKASTFSLLEIETNEQHEEIEQLEEPPAGFGGYAPDLDDEIPF